MLLYLSVEKDGVKETIVQEVDPKELIAWVECLVQKAKLRYWGSPNHQSKVIYRIVWVDE
jgi:hypothetical protein